MNSATPDPVRNLGDCLRLPARGEALAFVDLIDPANPHAVTALELDTLTSALANGLRRRGVLPADRVAIMAANRLEFVAAYLAVMRSGAVAVPVNYKLSPETIAHIFADAGCVFAFVDAERRELVPGHVPFIDFDHPEQFGAMLALGPSLTFDPSPDDLAEILYTSGSTGPPKGVPLTHAGQCWALNKQLEEIPPGGEVTRTLIAAPLYHMNALFFTTVALTNRITICSMPRFDASAYLDAVAHYQCALLTGVPTMFALAARLPRRPLAGLSHVTRVRMGSSPVTDALIAQVRGLFPNAAISNGYGTTEAGPAVFGAHPGGIEQPTTSVGYPLPDIEWRFANGSPTEGPFELRTPALTRGYLNRADANAERFHDGWYRTGDIMRRDGEGFFYFVGRIDDMFVTGGENIYPGEVEALLEQHPDIAQAAVVGVPHDTKGMAPAAFIVRKSGASSLSADEVKAFALSRGPAYAHPRHVFFVDALPLGGTAKVDRSVLLRQADLLLSHPPASDDGEA